MLKSSLCDYSDIYILVNGTIAVANIAASSAANANKKLMQNKKANANNANKKLIFKNYSPFINCISEINNTQIDHATDIDV